MKFLVFAYIVLLSAAGFAKDPIDADSPLKPMELALTVDDLPTHEDDRPWGTRAETLDRIAKVFKEMGVPDAYGFVNGYSEQISTPDMDILRSWLNAGFKLGNHTLHHMDLSKKSAKKFIRDIEGTDNLLASMGLDQTERRVLRFPFLHEGNNLKKREQVRAYLANNGYRIAVVTIDYWDWAWNDAFARCMAKNDLKTVEVLKKSAPDAAARALRRAQKTAETLYGHDIKHVVLMHQAVLTSLTLKDILSKMKNDGVKFISLDEALQDPAYSADQKVAGDNGNYLEQVLAARGMDDPFPETKYDETSFDKFCK